MLADYLPIFFYALFALGFCGAAALAAETIGKRIKAPGKFDTYECGMPPVGEARLRTSVHFYVIAVLFILFDVEAAFLLPWAAVARDPVLAVPAFVSVATFLGIAGIGLAVAWKKGALDWER